MKGFKGFGFIKKIKDASAIANRFATITTLLSNQDSQLDKAVYLVLDATIDPTVDSGFAYYEFLNNATGNLADYRKLGEQESLDVAKQVPTVTIDTGNTVDLSNPLGNTCNMASANGNASFTTENEVPLGGAMILINRATEPTVFDSNTVAGVKLLGADFIALTDMYLAIWSNGNRVDYKIIQIAE